MPSYSTVYTCPACAASSAVEVTDLGDPYAHIPERSQEALRGIRATENKLGIEKPGDPVDDLAQDLLAQDARAQLRYAQCPSCAVKNPEGIAADRAERRQTLLFGLIFFGAIAVAARFYPWVALIIPAMDLFVFRPLMFVQARKQKDKPFPVLPFIAGVLLDVLLIAVILLYPLAAPLIPIAGIIQSVFSRSSKSEWKWEDAASKLKFDVAQRATS